MTDDKTDEEEQQTGRNWLRKFHLFAAGSLGSPGKLLYTDRGGGVPSHLLKLLGWGREPNELSAVAAPGLITLLDVALYRANEGGLTATVCAANGVLNSFLALKRCSEGMLRALTLARASASSGAASTASVASSNVDGAASTEQQQLEGGARASSSAAQVAAAEELAENFARFCIDCSTGAMERIATDRLAQSANVSPLDRPAQSSGGGGGADPSSSASSAGGGPNAGQPLSSSSSAGIAGVADVAAAGGAAAQHVLEAARAGASATGRRRKLSRRDCWETTRLMCPDYVWADDVVLSCQRLVRTMARHPFFTSGVAGVSSVVDPVAQGWGGGVVSGGGGSGGGGGGAGAGGASSRLSSACLREAALAWMLLRETIPTKIDQFKLAAEANGMVSKRLYLVKCEYRAPFRAFLESHTGVLNAPSKEVVDDYLQEHEEDSRKRSLKSKRVAAERKVDEALSDPGLLEALQLEQQAELMEIGMAQMLLPFAELARVVDARCRGRLREVPGLLSAADVPALQEVVRRLKPILVRKADGITGIRSLLLDMQGLPRDDDALQTTSTQYPFGSFNDRSETEAIRCRVESLMSQLQVLIDLGKVKGGYQLLAADKKTSSSSGGSGGADLEKVVPTPLLKTCASTLDPELFLAQYEDWYALVKRQREVVSMHGEFEEKTGLVELAEALRRAEIDVGLAKAPKNALVALQEQLVKMETDRRKKFDVLCNVVEDVCLREIGIHIRLTPPDKDAVLELPDTSSATLGIYGRKLVMEGEYVPG